VIPSCKASNGGCRLQFWIFFFFLTTTQLEARRLNRCKQSLQSLSDLNRTLQSLNPCYNIITYCIFIDGSSDKFLITIVQQCITLLQCVQSYKRGWSSLNSVYLFSQSDRNPVKYHKNRFRRSDSKLIQLLKKGSIIFLYLRSITSLLTVIHKAQQDHCYLSVPCKVVFCLPTLSAHPQKVARNIPWLHPVVITWSKRYFSGWQKGANQTP